MTNVPLYTYLLCQTFCHRSFAPKRKKNISGIYYHGVCSLTSNYSVKLIEFRRYGFNEYENIISSAKWRRFFMKHAKNGSIWNLNYCSFLCYHGICSLISNYCIKWIETRRYVFNEYENTTWRAKWRSFFHEYNRKWFKMAARFM